MPMNKDQTRFWIEKGETAVIELKTLGFVEEYKGRKTRILGQKTFMHIATSAIFDGRKTALCGGGGCPYCENGHKASVQIRDVPIVVEGKNLVINMQKSLNNAIGEKIDAMKEFGHNPDDFLFKISHTQKKYPENWVVEVIRKDESEPKQGKVIGQKTSEEKPTKRPITDNEMKELKAIDDFLEESGETAEIDDWIETLVQMNEWDSIRASEIVYEYINKNTGRLK